MSLCGIKKEALELTEEKKKARERRQRESENNLLCQFNEWNQKPCRQNPRRTAGVCNYGDGSGRWDENATFSKS